MKVFVNYVLRSSICSAIYAEATQALKALYKYQQNDNAVSTILSVALKTKYKIAMKLYMKDETIL